MPRQQSSSSNRPTLPPPKLWHQAPALTTPAPAPIMMQRTLGQSIKDGVGLGIGSSIGHSIARSFGFGAAPVVATPLAAPIPHYSADPLYTQCLEFNKESPDVCKPFLSKDKSPWKECMETNGFQHKICFEPN